MYIYKLSYEQVFKGLKYLSKQMEVFDNTTKRKLCTVRLKNLAFVQAGIDNYLIIESPMLLKGKLYLKHLNKYYPHFEVIEL